MGDNHVLEHLISPRTTQFNLKSPAHMTQVLKLATTKFYKIGTLGASKVFQCTIFGIALLAIYVQQTMDLKQPMKLVSKSQLYVYVCIYIRVNQNEVFSSDTDSHTK